MPVQHEVGATYKVNAGPAISALGKIAAAAGKINHTFDRASQLLGTVASVGGSVAAAFSFENIVHSTKEHLEMVKRISVLTKTGATEADAMVETFARVGLSGQDAERIMLGMSRRASMMDLGMQSVNRSVGGTRSLFQHLGIDVRKGIEPALIRMSDLYRKGKLDVAQIGIAFGVPRQQALRMTELLEKGPAHIRKMIEEGKKFAVGEGTMKQMERMEMATHGARAALTRMQVMIGSEIMPVLADLMEDASNRIREWLPEVRKFGAFLRENLHMALGIIVKIGKVLLANYAIMKATGMGIGGWAGRGLSFVRGGGGAGGLAARGVGAVAGILGGGGIGPMTATMATVVRIVSMIGRFTIIGVVAMIAWKAFTAIRDNALGIRDTLLGFWKRLQGHFAVIAKLFAPVAKLFAGDGVIGKFFTVIIVTAIETVTDLIEGVMTVVETIIIAIKGLIDHPTQVFDLPKLFVEAYKEQQKMQADAMAAQEAERRATAAAERTTPEGRSPNHYDFRNSRFDITQKFEEGYDPDRIALAFSNDLANLGEKKLQSGFSPLFSVR